MPHIVLPTNTSNLIFIKKSLDYFYSNSLEINQEDFLEKTEMNEFNHKMSFLSYLNLIDKGNKINIKLITQFIYLYWENKEIRNKLLILSWLYTKLPSDWNSLNRNIEECFIIRKIFNIIVNSCDDSIAKIREKIEKFLTSEENISKTIYEIENIIIDEINLKTKVKKISGYFIGILKELNIIEDDKLNTFYIDYIKTLLQDLNEKEITQENIERNINSIITLHLIKKDKKSSEVSLNINTKINTSVVQEIVYGAPGTGKSFYISQEIEGLEENTERVTFYDGYSHNNFVGAY
ncbi:MAG: hypothetical protein ACRC6U_11575, partial [Fusobacteriaceae bacterium]